MLHSLGLSVPEEIIVPWVPNKNKDFASVIPDVAYTYSFEDQNQYYNDYKKSFYGISHKKGGLGEGGSWDCMRHYEILANGCIPYFQDLDKCPPQTMTMFPKQLVAAAMRVPGVYPNRIDHNTFSGSDYQLYANAILKHTKENLTTKAMGRYLLSKVEKPDAKSVLYLSGSVDPICIRDVMLHGLRSLLGPGLVDYPQVPHLYRSLSKEDADQLLGKGFTLTRILDDINIDRVTNNVLESIKNREYDLIVYGSVHQGFPLWSEVTASYDFKEIVLICGEDEHECCYIHNKHHHLFVKELKE